MVDNPVSNPGVSPIQPTPPFGPDKPSLGKEDVGERPFKLGPEGGKPGEMQPATQRPSPMEVAGDAARAQQTPVPVNELSDQISKLHSQFANIQQNLQNSNLTKNFTPDHFEAMQKVVQKMNPDMETIAKNTNGSFQPVQKKAGEGVLNFVSNWINGAQGTLGGALDYLQNTKKPDFESYLKLQYAMQRATQRGELFASIIGSSVSGIKTIMSTQLG